MPAATEIVIALGAADALVGVSHQCTLPPEMGPVPVVTTGAVDGAQHPADINADVARLSGTGASLFGLLGDGIASLQPDVILTQALCDVCAVREDDVRALANTLSPSPTVITIGAATFDGIFNDVTVVAGALGRADAAERLLAALRGRVRRVHDTLSASRAPRPRVAVIEWTDPPFAAGHWVPEMVWRAGGLDVLAVAGQHSRAITWESVISAAPEVILIAPCGYDVVRSAEEGRALVSGNAWAQRRSVWALDATNLVSQAGPRLVDGIETMAAIFNPALFPAPPSSHAVALSLA